MSSIKEFYLQSSLSFAAYAKLFPDITQPSYGDALRDAGMSEVQANDFASTWAVIDQCSDSSGASATVFEEVDGDKRYLAIRGTESLGDIGANYILARGFPEQVNPQFIGLQGAVQEWIDDGTLSNTNGVRPD